MGINTFGVQLDGNNDAAMFELFAAPEYNLSAAELAPLWQGPTRRRAGGGVILRCHFLPSLRWFSI